MLCIGVKCVKLDVKWVLVELSTFSHSRDFVVKRLMRGVTLAK